MIKTLVPAILSFVLFISVLFLWTSSSSDSKIGCPFHCPRDDSYPPSCLDNVIPPWPICLFKSVDEWVEKAQDGASRCCGYDLSECKCPKKDTDQFLDKIDAWCDGVDTCGDEKNEAMHGKALVGGFEGLKDNLQKDDEVTATE
mmetsp:Transcript_4651/g.6049  ORF Transcript_4651/g.6049 Transcript_4651/m.6049 type:complete len:144 (-) Transcript_4651:251-682(-)